MAIDITAAGNYVIRSTDLPAADPLTMCGWVYLDTDRNATGAILELINDTGAQFQGAFVGSSGTTLLCSTQNGSGTGSELTIGQWYFIAYTRNAGNHVVYLGDLTTLATSNCTRTADNNTLTPVGFLVAGSNSVNWIDGGVAMVKIWTAALSLAEVQAEQYRNSPARRTSLHLWTPTLDGTSEMLLDYSGNSRNWTAGGTPGTRSNPAVAWPVPPALVVPTYIRT